MKIKYPYKLVLIAPVLLISIALITGCKREEPVVKSDMDEVYGLVSISVCNMRPEPAYNTELISQAVMGTPVRILDSGSGWYSIRSPESYEGWVPSYSVKKLGQSELMAWKSSDRLIYTAKFGDIMSDTVSGDILSDIVAGAIVILDGREGGYYRVSLPDGRSGYIETVNARPFDIWLSESGPEGSRLKKSAERFKGIPYLWGGTSPKAFDCSGFTRTVYYLNGVILSRDASQQFMHGIKIGKEGYPDSLMIGDLMFFGYERDGVTRATHVGIYIGDGEFIHASGMVKINSLDSARSNYSSGRRNSFLGARRIIGAEAGEGIQFITEHPWYN
jgi:SH3-like domain-containing protein